MANSYISPLEGNNAYVASDAFVSNKNIDYQALEKLGKLSNYAIAAIGTGPVLAQQWNNGVNYYSNVNTTTVCIWRVPILSSLHYFHRINVKARGTNGTITWRVTSSAGQQNFTHSNTLNTNSYIYMNQLLVAFSPNSLPYYTIELRITGAVDIESIYIDAVLPVSPVSTSQIVSRKSDNTVDTVYGIGDTSLQPDTPLSTSKAYNLIKNIEVLNTRPRSLFHFSGLLQSNNGVTNPFNSFTIHPQKAMLLNDINNINQGFIGIPYWGNTNRIGAKYSVHIYQLAAPFNFKFNILGRDITLSSSVTDKWVTVTFDENPDTTEIEEQSLSTPLVKVDISTPNILYESQYNYTPIASISIWGV
jgi:hypothetical protein